MAGRLQIETVGTQDKYFTDDPEFSFFTQAHKKHTHFVKQNISIQSGDDTRFGGLVSYKLPQNQGDMISKISFEFELEPIKLFNYGYVDSIGHAILEYVDLMIGGVLIERITTDYLQIYSEQSTTETKQYGLFKTVGKKMITNITDNYTYKYSLLNFNKNTKFVVDIPFYFYKKPHMALPICALKNQEVEIQVRIRKLEDVIISRNFIKFSYPQVPYQRAYDRVMNQNIHFFEFLPELDLNEIDGTPIHGLGIVTSETYTRNRITPYIYALIGDTFQYYGVGPYRLTQYVPELERESISFWRFQTNILYKNSDPAFNAITDGRASGSGQQFVTESNTVSSATSHKYNTFVVGNPTTGDIVYYVDKREISRINLGIGYGQSLAMSDDTNTVAVGQTNGNTLKIINYTNEITPVESKTITAASAGSLRYTRISGDGSVVASLDITTSVLYIFHINYETVYSIPYLEPACHFALSGNGRRLIVGLQAAESYRLYTFDGTGYVLFESKPLYATFGTEVFVAISRDGEDVFYTERYIIKSDTYKEFNEVKITNFKMNTEVILLDEYEKDILINTNRDFTITQIQQSETQLIPLGEYNWEFRTTLTNPIKELYIVFQCQRYDNSLSIAPCNYDNIDIEVDYLSNLVLYEHMYNLRFILDGQEVINEDNGNYLFLKAIQSGLHHIRTPTSRRFYSYSFSTDPEDIYPTGQRNFSVINNQVVKIKLIPQDKYRRELRIYALSYNVLRLENGYMRMVFPFQNVPLPTTPNGLVGPNDRLPFLFANRSGYTVPCECPPAPGCAT
ncbi:hypothetical protein [Dishui Lake phycodnavirus 4]|nr:hypothetical protein [Dishui Lake phycodnavirus 4]